MSARLVEFPLANLRDVAAAMRRTADRIEAGAFGEVTAAVAVLLDDGHEVHVFGWGELGRRHEAIGLLTAGALAIGNGQQAEGASDGAA